MCHEKDRMGSAILEYWQRVKKTYSILVPFALIFSGVAIRFFGINTVTGIIAFVALCVILRFCWLADWLKRKKDVPDREGGLRTEVRYIHDQAISM